MRQVQGGRQKNFQEGGKWEKKQKIALLSLFQRGATEKKTKIGKKKTENSTIKPFYLLYL